MADLLPDPSWSPTLSYYGFLSLDILRTLASHRSLYVLTFERRIHDVRLTQLSIGDLVNLVDIADHMTSPTTSKDGVVYFQLGRGLETSVGGASLCINTKKIPKGFV